MTDKLYTYGNTTDKKLPPIYSKDGYHNTASLRDYFAAKAMQGDWARERCAVFEFAGVDVADPYGKAAEVYYRMADAMLKARGES